MSARKKRIKEPYFKHTINFFLYIIISGNKTIENYSRKNKQNNDRFLVEKLRSSAECLVCFNCTFLINAVGLTVKENLSCIM